MGTAHDKAVDAEIAGNTEHDYEIKIGITLQRKLNPMGVFDLVQEVSEAIEKANMPLDMTVNFVSVEEAK